jgi:hypothetical protein
VVEPIIKRQLQRSPEDVHLWAIQGQQANEPDEQPRGEFVGIMEVDSAWLLAGYRRR